VRCFFELAKKQLPKWPRESGAAFFFGHRVCASEERFLKKSIARVYDVLRVFFSGMPYAFSSRLADEECVFLSGCLLQKWIAPQQRNSRSPREGATLNECFLRRTARATTLQNFFHRSSPNKDELSFCEILARAKTKTHTRTRQTVPSVTNSFANTLSSKAPHNRSHYRSLCLSLSLSLSPSLVCRSRSSPSLCPVTSPSLPLQYPLVVVFETHPSQQRESTNHVLRALLLHVGRRFTFASRWQSACSQWSSQDQN
jgi:hypothetical protein